MQLHALRDRAAELEGVIAAQAVSRRRELETAQLDGLRRLALAAEYRDDNTHEHTQRVGHLAALLARDAGLGDRMVRLVREAAPLHDLGKIAIPDSILLKPGRLSDEEYEVVKTHALLGARVLSRRRLRAAARWPSGSCATTTSAGTAAATRTGWPARTSRVVARIAAVADVFDVLVHERPYKDSWSVEAAAEEIRKGAGTQFDPAVVEAFDALGPGGLAVGRPSRARRALAPAWDHRRTTPKGVPRWSPPRPHGCSSSPTAPPPRRRCSRPCGSAPASGPCAFTLLVPQHRHGLHRLVDPEDQGQSEAEATLELALPLLEKAAGAPVEGMVGDPEPLAAIQDAVNLHGFDEIIISTLPKRFSRWLRLDLPHKAAGLGLPVTTVTARGTGGGLAV